MQDGKKGDISRLAGNLLLCLLLLALMAAAGRYYPFIRELTFLYLAVGLIGLSARAAVCRREGKHILPGCLPYGTAWYQAVARVFLLGTLLLLVFGRPDYFHANILVAACMVLLSASCISGILAGLGKVRAAKKKKWALPAALAGTFLYLALGVFVSGFRQPGISDEFLQNLDISSFYGLGESGDRAVILEDNKEALLERVRMIRGAKERVILSTFDFRADGGGKVVIAALLEAAGRGVDVKVVVDGVSGLLRMGQNPYFLALSSHPNVEVRIYNKINLLKPWTLMGRLHDKYLMVDQTAYVLGGRNTFSYFLGDTDGHINYDRDVFVYNATGGTDSSLYQVEAYFKGIWEHKATGKYHAPAGTAGRISVLGARRELGELYSAYLEKNPEAFQTPDYAAMTFPVNKITLLANPTGTGAKEPTVFYALTALMEQASKNVMIHTPYIICNEMMYDAFARIAGAVPEAGLLTNSAANNGNPFGSGDYQENFGRILATGIQLYEYEGGVSYHGKSIAIDDDISIIGSFNMDMRSVYLDTELMLVIDSRELNRQLREIMEGYGAKSGKVLPDGTRIYPEGVLPQEMGLDKKIRVKIIYMLLGWARRLL